LGAEQRPLLAIAGQRGITNVGESFERAALQAGIDCGFFDIAMSWRAPKLLRALSWRLRDRLPPRAAAFEQRVVDGVEQTRPRLLLITGIAPLRKPALARIRRAGTLIANFLTDDPWNPGLHSAWFDAALTGYDVVFSPRRANLEQLAGAGVPHVHYLPFGYDPELLVANPAEGFESTDPEHLFVGGCDADRAAFVARFLAAGGRPTLIGGYWERFAQTRALARGGRVPSQIVWLTCAAVCCVILVRRANRDGHVMRSLEAGAAGGALLVEDTQEHRDIFGADGECVRYFDSPERAAQLARAIGGDADERQRLMSAVRARIGAGAHRYQDRLAALISQLEADGLLTPGALGGAGELDGRGA